MSKRPFVISNISKRPRDISNISKRPFVVWNNLKSEVGQCSWAVFDGTLVVKTHSAARA
jgi:hypothetical protein